MYQISSYLKVQDFSFYSYKCSQHMMTTKLQCRKRPALSNPWHGLEQKVGKLTLLSVGENCMTARRNISDRIWWRLKSCTNGATSRDGKLIGVRSSAGTLINYFQFLQTRFSPRCFYIYTHVLNAFIYIRHTYLAHVTWNNLASYDFTTTLTQNSCIKEGNGGLDNSGY
ncbi:hypothetical protein P154DRAFT_335628 [Amniculicola lignicola CBS 123094]|uniref:Uncharacterized protein n=1 Tax=Amniculicola lignicola CBS 123094 TaxID=1392246 RepID=A0A6A5W484_9PLEO|nr:hypothetical protein P154DRAFT_335628 [Amniculicola lignicola CBS 123094]